MNSKKYITNRNRIHYGDARLMGWTSPNGYYISPKIMKLIHEFYEKKLLKNQYQAARSLEKERQLPRTWLTSVASSLINRSESLGRPELPDKLKTEFADRGFRPSRQTNYAERSVHKS